MYDCHGVVHSEKGLVKSTTDIQLRIISSHQTIFNTIKYAYLMELKMEKKSTTPWRS